MIAALIQTRINSTRLPGKSLKVINGKSLTEYVLDATRKSNKINFSGIIYPENDSSVFYKKFHKKCFCFGGDEHNVLSRYYNAVKHIEEQNQSIDHVIRLTADCPFLFFIPKIINKVIRKHLCEKNDLTHNRSFYGYPSGLDVEIFTRKALEIAYKECSDDNEKEHVTLFFKKRPASFKIGSLETPFKTNFNFKWSVDTIVDFERMEDLIQIQQLKTMIQGE